MVSVLVELREYTQTVRRLTTKVIPRALASVPRAYQLQSARRSPLVAIVICTIRPSQETLSLTRNTAVLPHMLVLVLDSERRRNLF